MKFYWNQDTHGRPKKNQPLYCVGLYDGVMELSTSENEKLDDEIVSTFINKYNDIVGKYETPNHIFYGEFDKTNGIFHQDQNIYVCLHMPQ